MKMVEQREFNYAVQGPSVADKQELISQAALAFLAKVRAGQVALSESDVSDSVLSDADLETLDRLLDPNDHHFLGNRTDLSVRANRRVWVARKN